MTELDLECNLPPEWQLPAYPSTSRDELIKLNKNQLINKVEQLWKNREIAYNTLNKDSARRDEVFLKLLKAKQRFAGLSQEKEDSYWGGQNNAPPVLSCFLDPRNLAVYNRFATKLTTTEEDYNYLYEKLKAELPKETIPTPFRDKSKITRQLAELKKEIAHLNSANTRQNQQNSKVKQAIVRCRALDNQLEQLRKNKRDQSVAVWKNENYIKYIDIIVRIHLCEQKLKVIRENPEEIEVQGPMNSDEMDEFEEVDDTEMEKDSAAQLFGSSGGSQEDSPFSNILQKATNNPLTQFFGKLMEPFVNLADGLLSPLSKPLTKTAANIPKQPTDSLSK